MMFDLDDDPYELNNLVGLNGMTAANSTIIQAEHMRCLLLDWMTRLDGSVGYCSDPAANYGQGNGDISEIRDRQSWTAIGFWTSASDTGVLEMGKLAWTGDAYVRHDWLDMGIRISEQYIKVSSMTLTGQDANLFSFDASTTFEFDHKACISIRVSFSSPATLSSTPVDASLVIQWSELGTGGPDNVLTIPLTMRDYDFEAQNLGYPPPPTFAATVSPAPTYPPTSRPPSSPLSNPTSAPISPISPGSTQAPSTFTAIDITTTSISPTIVIGTTLAPSTIPGENAGDSTLPTAMNGCSSPDCSNDNTTTVSAGGETIPLKLFFLFAVTTITVLFL